MKKRESKRVSKDLPERAAKPVQPGLSREASSEETRARAREDGSGGSGPGGDPDAEKFLGIEDLAGLIQPKRKRVMISIRLDAEVLEWYRSKGKGYQSYIGALLAAWKKKQESYARPRAGDDPHAGTRAKKRTPRV